MIFVIYDFWSITFKFKKFFIWLFFRQDNFRDWGKTGLQNAAIKNGLALAGHPSNDAITMKIPYVFFF